MLRRTPPRSPRRAATVAVMPISPTAPSFFAVGAARFHRPVEQADTADFLFGAHARIDDDHGRLRMPRGHESGGFAHVQRVYGAVQPAVDERRHVVPLFEQVAAQRSQTVAGDAVAADAKKDRVAGEPRAQSVGERVHRGERVAENNHSVIFARYAAAYTV